MTRESHLLAVKYAYQKIYMKKGERFYRKDYYKRLEGQHYIGSIAREKGHVHAFWEFNSREILEDVELSNGFGFERKARKRRRMRNPLDRIRQREMTREELFSSGTFKLPVPLTRELNQLVEAGEIVDPVQDILLPLLGIRIFPPNEVEMVGFEMGRWGEVKFVNKER
ncbi:MAG: hypothetical protein ACW99G_18705 [Candidatus Thorarchaeota archaeon]